MPGMRVHELAKEYGLSSKDMLDRLRDMKIPAKSHASMLGDAYVQKIRKEMGPASVEGDVEEGVAVNTVEAEELEAKKKAEEEERVRREAVVHALKVCRQRHTPFPVEPLRRRLNKLRTVTQAYKFIFHR